MHPSRISDMTSHRKVLPPGECWRSMPSACAAASDSSWSIVHSYIFGPLWKLMRCCCCWYSSPSRKCCHVKLVERRSNERHMLASPPVPPRTCWLIISARWVGLRFHGCGADSAGLIIPVVALLHNIVLWTWWTRVWFLSGSRFRVWLSEAVFSNTSK